MGVTGAFTTCGDLGYPSGMNMKEDVPGTDDSTLIVWSEKYVMGIDLLDRQHRELVEIINRLYGACLHGGAEIEATFKESMGRMVEYVRFHFAAEMELLEKIGYPNYAEHKKQHDQLVQNILDAAKDYGKGGTFVPNKFVRTLRDWVLSHIAVYDRSYSEYVAEQRKKGLLADL